MFSVSQADRSRYYKYLARLNFEAAKAADRKVGILEGYELAAPPPVMTLCAHSLELSLKAYLLDNGVKESEVRNLGHRLMRCWDMCLEMGADVEVDRKILEIIEDLLCSGRLRYGEKSSLGKVPVFGPLSELCEQCLEFCGAPTHAEVFGNK